MTPYGRLDRLVHRIAFASPRVQLAAAEMEETLFGGDIAEVRPGPPVFVTSLPRAGTTVLLTALAEAEGLAAHTYRDMPFVMAPLLWSRLSGRFRATAEKTERAHGDGVAVGFDSPEAFEEVIWRTFWPGKVGKDGIHPSGPDDADREAARFLERHMAKIVALRADGRGRYLSKNNANIARLDLLRAMFPEAEILVPMRAPMAQAWSLRTQHLRFLDRHRADPFARRYMADIAHDEFGALHRPVLFEGFRELADGLGPEDAEYWLALWIAAFEHVGRRLDGVRLLDHDAMCADPAGTGEALARLLGLGAGEGARIARHFRPARTLAAEAAAHRGPLRDRAEALHQRLAARAGPPGLRDSASSRP